MHTFFNILVDTVIFATCAVSLCACLGVMVMETWDQDEHLWDWIDHGI